ncbi:hypothetical protein ACWOC1_01165 [Enterococcus quebecensis]|uniref:Uncharacterized protein n=1 Tax=Enterococcus quebecensis TaxID=903983 RepID=A0A1E5GZ73_9ENTE|nr:hypothetical protein [Enterococcus quebecensis]OEG18009.1 hypothetical protein BCR23_14370 [Enterococcus quebecensis]OJG70514.1 hypothetical protein RV12_GL001925 [Enterococcus quebecensis]
MSIQFDFWNSKFNQFKNSIKKDNKGNIDFNALANFFLIYGKRKSGKSELVNLLLNNIFLSKKKVSIIRLFEDENGYIYYEDIKHMNNKDKISQLINNRIDTGDIKIDVTLSLIDKLLKSRAKKKIQIIWLDNIKLNGAISYEKIETIFNDKNCIKKIIMTTSDIEVKNFYSKKADEQFEFPELNYEVYKKYFSEDVANIKAIVDRSLFYKLKNLNNEELVQQIFYWGEDKYGVISSLADFYSHTDSINVTSEQSSEMFKNILSASFVGSSNAGTDLENLLLYLLMFPKEISYDDLTYLEKDPLFDFITEMENLKNSKIILEKNSFFKIDEAFLISKEGFIESYTNRRVKRDTALSIDYLLRADYPEQYTLRANNAKYFSQPQAQEYFLISHIRGTLTNDIKKYLPLETLDAMHVIDKLNLFFSDDSSEMFNKLQPIIQRKLQKNNSSLLEAEYHFLYLRMLLSSQERKVLYPIIVIQLKNLLRIYQELKDKREIEMQIKVGNLLAPQLINVLNNTFRKEAIEIFNETDRLIRKHMKINVYQYISYYVQNHIIASSILPYNETYYILLDLINRMLSKEEVFGDLNIYDVFPVVFSNLLGISFYKTEEDVKNVLTLAENRKSILKSYKQNAYKIINNQILSEFLLAKSYSSKELNRWIKKLKRLDEKNIVMNNIAGFYLLKGDVKIAREYLFKILKNNINDDFYRFYANYNLIVLDLLDPSSDENENLLLDRVKQLSVPALFNDTNIILYLKKRIKFLEKLCKQKEKTDIITLEKKLNTSLRTSDVIFKKIWLFSDYQYWS